MWNRAKCVGAGKKKSHGNSEHWGYFNKFVALFMFNEFLKGSSTAAFWGWLTVYGDCTLRNVTTVSCFCILEIPSPAFMVF